ncbi:MAG: flagellar basal body-associated FliL family protein [Alphaproteobacteria bacterium]|nr:flagellar basal body-associated FliL family protein [Alphaproteobacteria bacterium]MDD9919328.1 flagellar basal body-associated FliL family protein [Alphaproteobacteria bacterium]
MAEENQTEEEIEESEEGGEEEFEEEGGSGGGGKKLILFIALGAILIGGAVAGGVFFLMGDSEPEEEIVEEVDPLAELTDVAFFDVPQVSVNLLSDGRASRYLKIKVSLELESEVDVETVKAILPRIQDDFQTFLRQLRPEDIRGSSGMHRLREGLLVRAKQSAAPARVRNVLFKEIVVQ